MSYIVSVNNKKIYDFYNTYKNISFEDMSSLMVDILKKVLKKQDSSLDSNLAQKLLMSMDNLESRSNQKNKDNSD
jgi:hypothetical protein